MTALKENRITSKFAELQGKGEKALITFVTAGDPNLDKTEEFVLAMDKAGVDIIELGIPFSDPLADGPIIQKASQRALKGGVNIAGILDVVKRLRKQTEIPIILMTYLNPLYSFGLENLCKDAKKAGVDGLIIPDLPFEERDIIADYVEKEGLVLIPLIAPTTPKERIKSITAQAEGFLYCVSVTGVTGIKGSLSNNIEEFLKEVKENSSLPVAVGFGISTPDQGVAMARLSDGVIVGSALVKIIEDKGVDAVSDLVPLVQSFKGALVGIGRGEPCLK